MTPTARDKSPIANALVAATTNRFNAWTAVNQDAVTQYAQTRPAADADERVLAGLPCGIKDNIDVAGLPTALGSAYPASTPVHDAAVVHALRRAGAAIIGKNAMHEIAYGSTGMVSAATPAQNPRAVGRVPGGSSSGSGGAGGGRPLPFAIGTDTGGSVRVPAALCGIVGLRPTTGSLDPSGVSPLAPSLDTPGILAATVDIAEAVWHAVSGTAPGSPNAHAPRRVGVMVNDYFADGSHAIQDAVQYATSLLRRYGCTTVPVQLSWIDTALTVYSHIVGAEAALTHRERLSRPPSLFQPETLQRLITGAHVPRAEYIEAMNQRDHIKDDVLRIFDHHDALICPTTPVTAPKQNQPTVNLGGRSIEIGRALITYTAPWSLAGAPSLAVPLGHDPHGLPTSIQIVGRPGNENTVLNTGSILDETRRHIESSP